MHVQHRWYLLVAGAFVVVAADGRAQPARVLPAPAPDAAPLEITPERPLTDLGRMWRLDAPPNAYWRARYGTAAPDATWLTQVRRAVLRIPGCTASFVSPHGLILTNHHCAREAATQVQPADSNYAERGFFARSLAEERRIDGFTAERLEEITDVTARVRDAVTARNSAVQAAERREAIAAIEDECAQRTRSTCEVVTLYQGGQYALYRYTAFTDVRLVAVPEAQIAFFGGDLDNFTYPRWNLDFALLRAYDSRGEPVVPSDVLRWHGAGVVEEEPVFVIGHPGSTSRLHTVAQLEYERDHGLPLQLLDLEMQRDALVARAGATPTAEALDEQFSLENALKAVRGQLAGLRDSALMARKRRFEASLRQRVRASPRLHLQYGVAWERIAAALMRQAVAERTAFAFGGNGSALWSRTLGAVRVPLQGVLADVDRLPLYLADGLEAVRQRVIAPVPIDTAAERAALTAMLSRVERQLPATDPVRRALLAGRTPAATAAAWMHGTRMASASERRKLLEGGARAAATSSDPLVVAARLVEPVERRARTELDALAAVISTEAARVGAAQYAVFGDLLPPDATFTLRISDGVVRGYPMNGTRAPWHSTFYGLYGRWTEFGRRGAYALPPRWVDRRELLDLATPFTFVSTNDIVGGNSGSPVVNAKGELVGLVFDGNIESLPGEYLFDDTAARTVSVHAAAITTALRVIYDAGHLADELERKAGPRRVVQR
jgi:hypothetical protein